MSNINLDRVLECLSSWGRDAAREGAVPLALVAVIPVPEEQGGGFRPAMVCDSECRGAVHAVLRQMLEDWDADEVEGKLVTGKFPTAPGMDLPSGRR